MRCAVCQTPSGLVVNIIMADPTDLAPDGCFLVGISDDVWCDIGYTWDGNTFIAPPADEPAGA